MARMLLFDVGRAGRVVEVADFDAVCEIIAGYVQVVPLAGRLSILCDEDGRLNGLPVNRRVDARAPVVDAEDYAFIVSMDGAPLLESGAPGYHEVLGTFLVCRGNLDKFASVTDRDMRRFGVQKAGV